MGKFEIAVVTTLELLMVMTIIVGTIKLFVIFVDSMPSQSREVDSANALLPVLQNAYGGVLMVLLGLELLQTLKAYFREHHLQIEVILVVAMIAIGRHIIQIDIAHMPGAQLAGLALLIASLAASYFLVKKAHFSIRGLIRDPGPPSIANDVPGDFQTAGQLQPSINQPRPEPSKPSRDAA